MTIMMIMIVGCIDHDNDHDHPRTHTAAGVAGALLLVRLLAAAADLRAGLRVRVRLPPVRELRHQLPVDHVPRVGPRRPQAQRIPRVLPQLGEPEERRWQAALNRRIDSGGNGGEGGGPHDGHRRDIHM